MNARPGPHMPITIDESAHPIIRVVMEGASSDEEYEAYHAKMSSLLAGADASRVQIGTVVDARTSQPPSAKQRRRMAELLESTQALQRRASFGWSIVLASAVQRGVLTAILWIRPIPVPHYVAATPADAEAWLRKRLRAEDARADRP